MNELIVLYGFVLPLWGFLISFGLQMSFDRAISMFMLLGIILSRKKIHLPKYVLPFIGLTFVITFVFSFFQPIEYLHHFTLERGKYRWVFQLVLFSLFFIIPITFISNFINPKRIINTLRYLILSSVILAILGMIQFYVFWKTKVDIFPIGISESVDAARTAPFEVGKLIGLVRISSLGGEPKNLAYTLVIAFLIIFGEILNKSELILKKKYRPYFFLLMFSCLIGTISTQGFLMIPIGILIMLSSKIILNGSINKKVISIFMSLILVVIFLSNVEPISSIIKARTFERLSNTGLLEDTNETIQLFFLDNPLYLISGVGMGQIHLFAQGYIPDQFLYYMTNVVFVAKNGYLKIISDVGVIGLLSFCFGVFFILKDLKSLKYLSDHQGLQMNKIRNLLFLVLFTSFPLYLIVSDGPPFVYFFIGIAIGFIKISRKCAV
jgi:hypothetical protein